MPKTGLSDRMRAWMRGQAEVRQIGPHISPPPKQPVFTARNVYEGLNIPPGKPREMVQRALHDFADRWEIVDMGVDRRCRKPVKRYCYNTEFEKNCRMGNLRDRILKAMRILSFHEAWAVTDIVRHTRAKRSFIDKITGKLLVAGHLSCQGSRARMGGYGQEKLYRVANQDRFRKEVMG